MDTAFAFIDNVGDGLIALIRSDNIMMAPLSARLTLWCPLGSFSQTKDAHVGPTASMIGHFSGKTKTLFP
jgi:hypothetical protein